MVYYSGFLRQSCKITWRLLLRNSFFRTINLLFGFFLATVLSTLTGQTGDWIILGASIIVGFIEYSSGYFYSNYYNQLINSKYYYTFNDLRIGIMYGLFVDSFKLGS
uniref:Uncharacterized protein ycf20 n=1 Tax=Apophlaea sinclairii TaxID=212746 RepID=A0A1C9CBM8_9FLOR|nr:hypothetical protein Apop_064 [Apophlaea sinclairii]AOM65754.1 hypothetical protein Apop_064 [Apophlaea sinclairii]